MRISNLFSITLREAPSGAEIASHQLLLRAGFIRPLGAGIFSYLPLARRSMNKIQAILHEEMALIGGQEITMPVIHPAEVWQVTGRWYQIGSEMGRFKDKNNHDMVLAMTHEEVVADLVKNEIHSYKQLPALIYHIQTKWRDDPRPRAGLIRVREFTMLDSYSLDVDWEGLQKQYQAHYDAYLRIFKRCGLPAVAVQSDMGIMGGKIAHEFMYLSPIGEDSLIFCDHCGYAANRQTAEFKKSAAVSEQALPVEKVATPGAHTIEELSNFLKIPASRTAKAVFMVASIPDDNGGPAVDRFVFAVVRGDMEVNETKLANCLKARDLRPAVDEEIISIGAVPGYASPVGLKKCLIVVDDAIVSSPNLVAGANLEGYHLRNVNFGRDYSADIVTDISAAYDGAGCPQCGEPMHMNRGVELGNIFQLGTRYSDSVGCTFLDENGQTKPVIMGSYGIGVGRLLACIAEEHHDEKGLCWPVSVAPYPLHLVALVNKSPDVHTFAETLYEHLCSAGLEPLYDDRIESPGVKFNDADLIGLPIRVTISERSLKAGGVEVKRRRESETSILPLNGLEDNLRRMLAE
ncbi:MAG TPA: proline--tRNA ligase [Longilinea sp.]|nr:proline--tRNA ligase [Longilinea sp.]